MIFDRHEKGNTIDIVLPFCFQIVYRYAHRKLNPFFKKILNASFAKVNAAPESICYSSQIYKNAGFMRLTLISRRNQMNTAQPIRNLEDLKNFKNYYKEIHPNVRNQLLVILGLILH